VLPKGRRETAHLVTEARKPRSEDIAYRERRYLIMMGFRVACFVLTIVLFASGAGWLAAIPAVGAITIPYFAVVFANGGREPTSTRGFRAYEPKLPERYGGPAGGAPGSHPTPGQPPDGGPAGPGQE
jgi:Protein of unknown function (DUF3099)